MTTDRAPNTRSTANKRQKLEVQEASKNKASVSDDMATTNTNSNKTKTKTKNKTLLLIQNVLDTIKRKSWCVSI